MNTTFKIKEGLFSPTVDSLKNYVCPDWFRDAKFGIWSHWGPQSVPMYGDWYARHMYTEGHAQYYYHWRKYADTGEELAIQGLANLKKIEATIK